MLRARIVFCPCRCPGHVLHPAQGGPQRGRPGRVLPQQRGLAALHAHLFSPGRRGDPNAEGQDEFCPSSAGWPPFMRVYFHLGAGGTPTRRARTRSAPAARAGRPSCAFIFTWAQGGPQRGGPGRVLPQQRGLAALHARLLSPGRRGDPNAEGQDAFCPSSAGWPPFMRVNPVLGWGYGDVWALLRAARLPYCALYDRGFTSIGSVTNTRPNRRAPAPRARSCLRFLALLLRRHT